MKKKVDNRDREKYWNIDTSSLIVDKKGTTDKKTSNKEAVIQYIKSLLE